MCTIIAGERRGAFPWTIGSSPAGAPASRFSRLLGGSRGACRTGMAASVCRCARSVVAATARPSRRHIGLWPVRCVSRAPVWHSAATAGGQTIPAYQRRTADALLSAPILPGPPAGCGPLRPCSGAVGRHGRRVWRSGGIGRLAALLGGWPFQIVLAARSCASARQIDVDFPSRGARRGRWSGAARGRRAGERAPGGCFSTISLPAAWTPARHR